MSEFTILVREGAGRTLATVTPVCAYFVGCDNLAAGVTAHPVLTYVPTCQPCADRFGLEVIPAVWEISK
jgi:hypothetical protein